MSQKSAGAYIFHFYHIFKTSRCKNKDMWEARCMGNDPWPFFQNTSIKHKNIQQYTSKAFVSNEFT